MEPVMDPQITGMAPGPPAIYVEPQMPPQSDVDEFLRKKRKAREHKACYPCRQRKVKCDLSRPCQTCRDRDHPELCSYHPPNKRQQGDQGHPILKVEEGSAITGMITLGRAEFDMLCNKLNGLENSIAELRRELGRSSSYDQSSYSHQPNGHRHEVEPAHHYRGPIAPPIQPGPEYLDTLPQRPSHYDVHGIHTRNDTGEIVHFGAGSIPAMLYSLGQGQGYSDQEKQQLQEFLGKSVLPLFGLDNESATYPFVDLWGLPHGSLTRAQELAKALPGDAQLMHLWRCYRDMGWVIYPGIADPERFEQEVTSFVVNRTAAAGSSEGLSEQSIFGQSYQWLGMLFACLASGAQCSQMPRKERELTSQVYICCSFECLRFTNFLSQPTLESIQSLCVMGNVMMNNMNAGTTWCLLGLTIRLAEGLGLHRSCPPHIPMEHVLPRARIWWAILWQDSLLSITYDRASTTASFDTATMPPPQHYAAIGPYHATMYRLCKCMLDIVRDRASTFNPRERHQQIIERRDAISQIMRECAEYLRDSRKCTTTRETLEHWALYLHTSYTLSELYRPAISPGTSNMELLKSFKQSCIDNLANTVESYLGLNNITSYARQSWASMHRALGSALLLGILGEHLRNDRARRLIGRFIAVMADITNSIDPAEITAPVHRGINALRKLKIQELRPPSFGDETNILSDGTAVSEEGLPQVDHTQIVTPANSDDHEGNEHSPYSVLNSILWGSTDPALRNIDATVGVQQPPALDCFAERAAVPAVLGV
ncbi:GAL4-like Zn(II)2Cys6 (or C6 zinc) binuclear cluster DNA-binding domain [Teratosphaeria destructans]|uniref:GAL4-like Zn(II)2Cys6 (Or C6 zinc) binuclear cluster DNA-binding domain n=1 Tax=Teratosphaeria destructans TaxID=418781 RepID=A0A9W7VXN4_9PEZI|nr:GAL4-like Zn(II)2Cys6 (or C6 zinc) binuclear cluster DNA-binding domain [Teratosphaeria destructans]